MSYAPHGAINQLTFGTGGVQETTTYNPQRLQPTAIRGSSSSGPLLTLDYNWCPAAGCQQNNGNLASQTITVGSLAITQAYGYDNLNRLSSVIESAPNQQGFSQGYVYDAYGNRAVGGTWIPNGVQTPQSLNDYIDHTPQSPNTNHWLAWTPSFTNGNVYDVAGNLQKVTHGFACSPAPCPQYGYDAENRMISATSLQNTPDTTYVYDGDGRRVQKIQNATATTYVYDATGNLAAEYGTPTDHGTKYLLTDHLGSTRVLVASDGTSPKRYDYLPFGEEIPAGTDGRGPEYSSGMYPGPVGPQSLEFTSKERDAETGLDWFAARYFSGAQGRFTSPDPEGIGSSSHDPQSWNMYAYARNNPLRYTDPFGLNYDVCDADGKNCRTLSDAQYNSYLKSIQGTNTYVTPGGTINYQNDNGSVTKVGSASYYNERAENAGAFLNWSLLQISLNAVGEGIGRGVVALAGRAFEALSAGRAAGQVAEDAIGSTPVGRRGAPLDVTPGTNTGTKIGDRWYTGHALDQMQGRGAVPSVVEDTISSGTKSPGNLPNTVKYSTSQADVVTNTRGDDVTVIVKGSGK